MSDNNKPQYGDPGFEQRAVACNDSDCGWTGVVSELGNDFEAIPDLTERIAPGEVVPVGECPVCRALAHLV